MEDTVLQKSSEIKEGCKMIESDDKRKTASTRQGGTQRKGGGKIISSAEHEMGVKIKTSLHLRCPLLFPFVCFLKFAPSSFISLRPFSLHFFISFRPIYLPSSGRRLFILPTFSLPSANKHEQTLVLPKRLVPLPPVSMHA